MDSVELSKGVLESQTEHVQFKSEHVCGVALSVFERRPASIEPAVEDADAFEGHAREARSDLRRFDPACDRVDRRARSFVPEARRDLPV